MTQDTKILKQNKISVVTTTYNNEREIASFLRNVYDQTYAVDEIVIVDGGSRDNTVTVIQQYENNAKHNIILKYGERLNIAQGLNKAISISSNEIICILGVGNYFPLNFIEKLLEGFLEEKADVICPIIKGMNRNLFSYRYNMVYLDYNRGVDGCFAPNHGCLAKRDIFYKLGFFYEKFVYAGEDAEFYSRARNEGYRIISQPDITLYWETPCTFNELFRQIRLYTIAENQWKSKKNIIKEQKKNVISCLCLFMGILVLCFKFYGVGIVFVLLFISRPIYWVLKYGITPAIICFVKNYYKLFCHFRYALYLGHKYRVLR